MDVTRKNQEAAYQDLVALLPHCEFYALDLEMTGIRAPAKLLQRRELAVAAAKGQSVYQTVTNYDDGNGVNNKTKVEQCPLLAHPQLQPPRESYDEKIVAASTFNVVQLGLSLFFKKDTKVIAPRGVVVLGNAPPPPPVSDGPTPSTSPSTEALLEKEKGAATVKRSSKLHSNNRGIPDVTLPLTTEGKALWLDVDKDLASLSSTESSTTTFVSVDVASAAVGNSDIASDPSALVAAALTRITDFIAKTCDEIKSVVDAAHIEGTSKTFLIGDEATLSGFAPMEDISAVKTKLSILDHHTRLFNSLTDAVQLKGLVEQFAVANGYGGGSLSSASSSQLVSSSFASVASPLPSASDAAPPKSISKSELSSTSGSPAAAAAISRQKWLNFDDLFTFVTLESGRLVEVPAARGSGSGNAFGASKKGGPTNESGASSPTPSSSVAASPFLPSEATVAGVSEEYTIRAFSFYLFPHPGLDARDMTMNSTTVGDFLATQSPISFDKWVKLGVHYISREKLLLLRNRNAVEQYAAKDLVKVSKKNNSEGSPMAQLKESCPSLTFQEIQALSTFLEKCRTYAASVAVAKASKGAKLPDPLPFPSQKPEAFSIIRKLLSELGLEKDGKVIVPSARGPATPKDKDASRVTDGGTDRSLSSTEASPRGSYTAHNKLFAKWQEKSHAAASAGTRVFEALVNCKKPIIVQNGWSDLAFLYTAFHGCTPLDLPAFKVAINALFPTVYDSRTLATLEQFNSFSNRGRLERMYLSFQQEYGKSVNIFVPEFGQELFAPDEKTGAAAAHDASYDSFITGSLFLYERAALRDAARFITNSSSDNSNNNNYSTKSYVADVYKFANIVPCYGSVFSIKLDDENTDVWLTASPSTPIIRVTFANESDYKKAPRALYSTQTKIKTHFSKQSLPGVVQVPKDYELFYFVDSNAKGLGGALFDFGLQQATPGITKDVGYPVKIEVMPMKDVFDLAGMSVKPFWPSK